MPYQSVSAPCQSQTWRNASDVLQHYVQGRAALALQELVELLRAAADLGASAHDERLSGLVQQVASQKGQLSLTALVDVSRAVEAFGFHRELGDIAAMIVESASFLSTDVILSFAKTLAIASQQAVNSELRAMVFRILGEHIAESMFETSPAALPEALLAIAVFRCGRDSAASDSALVSPWHHEIFESSAISIGSNPSCLSPKALVKCLRAYELFLVCGLRRDGMDNALPMASKLPSVLASALSSQLSDLSTTEIVRALHAKTRLHSNGLRLDAASTTFCSAAIAELQLRTQEMGLLDIAFALRALATLARDKESSSLVQREPVLELYGEVQRHVSSLGTREALMIARTAQTLVPIGLIDNVLELLAAELVRGIRELSAAQLCDTTATFAKLRFKGAGFFGSLQTVFVQKLHRCLPRSIANASHGFAAAGFMEHSTCKAVGKHVVNNMLAFQPRDVALCAWSLAKVSHQHKAFFHSVQEDLKRQNIGSSKLTPADVSMFLWSFSRVGLDLDPEVLSALAHYAAVHCSRDDFSNTAVLVTCLAFARLGFAQQTILVNLHRSLYARLPSLGDSQLSLAFFLFSTSGVRDDALLRRFLFESSERLLGLRGQNLANIVLACSRTVTLPSEATSLPNMVDAVVPASSAARDGVTAPDNLRDLLREQVFANLEGMRTTPLLGVYLAAPSLLTLSRDETFQLASELQPRFKSMTASELAHALVATANAEMLHTQFLLPLFLAIRQRRDELSGAEVISCIWSVFTLGFCKPKFRRTLCYRLLHHVQTYPKAESQKQK